MDVEMSRSTGGKQSTSVAVACFCLTGVFGFCLLIFFLGSVSGRQSSQPSSGYSSSENIKEIVHRYCKSNDPRLLLDCAIRKSEAVVESEHGARELLAQQQSAWAGMISAVCSLGALTATVLGLIWIKGTLDATRSGAEAAQSAVDEAKRIGEAQVRAYLQIISGFIAIQRNPSDFRACPSAVIEIVAKNFGQSPARAFELSFAVRSYPPLHRSFQGDTGFLDRPFLGQDVGVGDSVSVQTTIGPDILMYESSPPFGRDGTHMDIVARYRFRDVFNNLIEDERVFSAFISPGEFGVKIPLRVSAFDRETIELLAAANRRILPTPA